MQQGTALISHYFSFKLCILLVRDVKFFTSKINLSQQPTRQFSCSLPLPELLVTFKKTPTKQNTDPELEASGRLGTKPNAIKNAECCRNLLIGCLMFLLAFFIAVVTGGNPSVRGLAQSLSASFLISQH